MTTAATAPSPQPDAARGCESACKGPRPPGSHSRSVGRRSLTLDERRALDALTIELVRAGELKRRPKTFADCPPRGEPCGFVSCRHHLGINVSEDGQTVKITRPVRDTDPARAHLIERLTPRDRDIQSRCARGDSNGQIAAALGMRESTVKKVRCRTRSKLNVDPELDILAMAETCSLRVADKGRHSLDEVAQLMGGFDKAIIHRIEMRALAKLRAAIDHENNNGGDHDHD